MNNNIETTKRVTSNDTMNATLAEYTWFTANGCSPAAEAWWRERYNRRSTESTGVWVPLTHAADWVTNPIGSK